MIPNGTKILEVKKGSAAAKAGLEPGDRILTVNGHPTDDELALTGIPDARLAPAVAFLPTPMTVQPSCLLALGAAPAAKAAATASPATNRIE